MSVARCDARAVWGREAPHARSGEGPKSGPAVSCAEIRGCCGARCARRVQRNQSCGGVVCGVGGRPGHASSSRDERVPRELRVISGGGRVARAIRAERDLCPARLCAPGSRGHAYARCGRPVPDTERGRVSCDDCVCGSWFFCTGKFSDRIPRRGNAGMAAARAGRSDPRSDRYAGCACVRRAWTGTDRARGALGPRIADRGPPGPGVVNRTRPGATGTARATDPHVCHVTPKAPRQRHHPAPPCTPLRNWAAAGSFRTIPCDGTQTICGAPHAAVNACRTKPIRVAASRTPKLTVYSPAAAWRMPSSPTSESSASVG